MKSVLLILNGEVQRPEAVARFAKQAGFIVAVDGATQACRKLKIEPNIVLGDMDSLKFPLPKWKDTTYLCDFDEDTNDFEKALSWLTTTGCGPVAVAGALGGRIDHSIVNLAVAAQYSDELDLTLIGQGAARLLGPGQYAFAAKKGALFSLIPVSSTAKVTTHGLKYAVKKGILKTGSRGLSNQATGAKVAVEVHAGRLWVVES